MESKREGKGESRKREKVEKKNEKGKKKEIYLQKWNMDQKKFEIIFLYYACTCIYKADAGN